jgi:hypothetical protein
MYICVGDVFKGSEICKYLRRKRMMLFLEQNETLAMSDVCKQSKMCLKSFEDVFNKKN